MFDCWTKYIIVHEHWTNTITSLRLCMKLSISVLWCDWNRYKEWNWFFSMNERIQRCGLISSHCVVINTTASKTKDPQVNLTPIIFLINFKRSYLCCALTCALNLECNSLQCVFMVNCVSKTEFSKNSRKCYYQKYSKSHRQSFYQTLFNCWGEQLF